MLKTRKGLENSIIILTLVAIVAIVLIVGIVKLHNNKTADLTIPAEELENLKGQADKNIPFCQQSQNPKKPNIIFILVDDLSEKEVGYLPGIKRLLQDQGTTFKNFYIPNSQCCPSRASILRGQYSHNTKIMLNGNKWAQTTGVTGGYATFKTLNLEDSTVAVWLHDTGYKTMLAGKYMNGYEDYGNGTFRNYIPPGWDEWYAGLHGIYQGFNYSLNENGNIVFYGDSEDSFLADVLTRKTVNFISQSGTSPFFIYLAPTNPHGPYPVAPRHANSFSFLNIPNSPSFQESDVSDKPSWIRTLMPANMQAKNAGVSKIEIDSDMPNSQQAFVIDYHKRLQSMLSVEDMVRELIKILRNTCKLDNTYIFLASDNGYHFGEHWLPPGKGTLYEEDVRVPLIVRGPGVEAGKTLTHYVLNSDLAPTFADIAGVEIPSFVDGKSFKPILQNAPLFNDTLKWRRRVLLERWNDNIIGHPPDVFGIRTIGYMYANYTTGEEEFYVMDGSLYNDPYQTNSRHNDSSVAWIVQRQRMFLSKLKNCTGQSCRDAELLTLRKLYPNIPPNQLPVGPAGETND